MRRFVAIEARICYLRLKRAGAQCVMIGAAGAAHVLRCLIWALRRLLGK